MGRNKPFTIEEMTPDPSSAGLPSLPIAEWIERELSRPEEPWLLKNLVMPGGLTIVGGREKLGKSFHSMLMCIAMSSGRRFGPFDPVGRSSALYLDLEGVARQTAQRVQLLAHGHGFTLEELALLRMADTRQFQLLENGGAANLVNAIREYGIQAVVMDTFARAFAGDENSKKDTQKFLDVASEIRATTGCAVIMPHHVNKASFGYKDVAVMMDPSAGLRGTSAIAAAYDVVVSCQDGWVEGEFQRFMVSRGKYTEDWWCSYAIKGEKDAEDNWTKSWLEFGSHRKELALIERGPSESQPSFRSRK